MSFCTITAVKKARKSWRLSPAREAKAAWRYADLIDTEDATACVQAAAEIPRQYRYPGE